MGKSSILRWTPTPAFLYRNYLYKNIAKDLPRNSFFLDVGAGNGDFLRGLAKLGFKGDAIDISEDAVRFAREYLKGLKEVTVKQADVFTYKPKGKYDVIFCFEVLEHIREDAKAMKKIFDLLRPGGVFIMSVPAHRSMWSNIDKVKGHYRRYEKDELVGKLHKAGFGRVVITCYGFPILTALRKVTGSGRFVKSATQHLSRDARGQESSIQEEYNPKLQFLATNKLILLPMFKLMDLFLNTNMGLGYISVCTKTK